MNYKTAPLLAEKAEHETSLINRFGPAPVNVFSRLRSRAGISQAELARRAQCSKLVILRTEQGTYSEPPPVVLDYWIKVHGYDKFSLLEEYLEFQQETRKRSHMYYGTYLAFVISDSEHPLRQLRSVKHLTLNEVSKALCIPQATLQYFERKWKTQQTVPKGLFEVLLEIGYSPNEVQRFARHYIQWRDLHKKGSR